MIAVSIRKDCDIKKFTFPQPRPLKTTLYGLLSKEVPDKYYISQKMYKYLTSTSFRQDADTIQKGDICKCLRAGSGCIPCVIDEKGVRKITPIEAWLLTGFDKSDCEKAMGVTSDTQLYKQAGNSIVVDVLMLILQNIFLSKNSPMVLSAWLDSILLGR